MSKSVTTPKHSVIEQEAKGTEEALRDGLSIIEMEERLEMVQVAAAAAHSLCRDSGSK